jgi:hypothetical protein
MKVWVPVKQEAISPDGDAYAFVRYQGVAAAVVVQSLKPAQSHQVLVSSGALSVIGYTRDGVYVEYPGMNSDGLWRAAQQSSSTQLVDSEPRDGFSWLRVEDGVAWRKGTGSDGGNGTRLVAVDLATKQKTTWFAINEGSLEFLGLAPDGAPVLEVFSISGVRLLEVTAVNAAREIAVFPSNPGFSSAHSDQFGVWFASNTAVWLFNGSVLNKVAIEGQSSLGGADRVGSIPVQFLDVAGPCET